MPRRETPETAWNPPGESAPARRHARVQVVGSLALLAVVVIALVVVLLG